MQNTQSTGKFLIATCRRCQWHTEGRHHLNEVALWDQCIW